MYEFNNICGQFGIDLKKPDPPNVILPHFTDQDIQQIVRTFYAFCGEIWEQLYEKHELVIDGVKTMFTQEDILIALDSAEVLVNLFLHLHQDLFTQKRHSILKNSPQQF